jgi:glycerophosphoryl diester phosphodiesterase
MIYAHRGANLRIPENTIEAFQQGLLDGADALELDVRQTKDDVVMVFHDDNGWRVARQRKYIAESTWAEIQTWDLSEASRVDPMEHHFTRKSYRVPTLEEVLVAFPGVTLNVDIKVANLQLVSQVIDLIRKYDAVARVRLTSLSWRVRRMLDVLDYPGPRSLSRVDIAMVYVLPAFMLPNLAGRAIQVPLRLGVFPLDTKAFIDKCHKLGLMVDYWVVNDRERARILWQRGADGIMTDDPAEILTSLAKSANDAKSLA